MYSTNSERKRERGWGESEGRERERELHKKDNYQKSVKKYLNP